jgi:hypothetical protein
MTSPIRSRLGKHPGRRFAVCFLILSLAGAGVTPSPAAFAKEKKEKRDPREMQAREAFAAGSYKDALDIYTKLYAEKLHPTFLRNIGRCYQNLDEPDRAISSFREYLRKAKDLPADERGEVEGYIKELEEVQKRKTAVVEQPKPEPQPLPPPVVQPPVFIVQPPPQPAPEPTPAYKKGWFWGVVVGAVALATVGSLAAAGVFSPGSGCPSNTICR